MGNNVLILIVSAVLIFLWLKPFYRSNYLIKSWAQENNLILKKKKLRLIRVGPFFYHKNRAVYRVHIETNSGEMKKAWIMLGDLFLINSDKLSVEWDPSENGKLNRAKDIVYFLTAIFYMLLISSLIVAFIVLIFDFGLSDYFKKAAQKWD